MNWQKPTVLFLILSAAAAPPPARGQTPDLSPDPGQPAAAIPDRPVSWRLLAPNLIDDQKHLWSFPTRLKQRRDWIPAAAILGSAAGLLLLDPPEARYFRRTPEFHGFNNAFSSRATSLGIIAAPASLYAVGLLRKDSKMQHTMLLAGEALADTGILTMVLKDATRRARPTGFPPSANFSDSWFDSRGTALRDNGSFPSGHTIAAFAVATVIADRYRNHRWVPYAAYGLAALVGFSRLSLSDHFLSDVFMGGALGYSISHFTVLHQ